MTIPARCAVVAATAVAAATLAGPALASYTPHLDVSAPNTLGTTGKTTIHFAVGAGDKTTARLVLYVPNPFSVKPGSPGSTIGTAKAKVRVGDLGGAILPVDGTIEVRDPTGVAVIGSTPVPLSMLAIMCTGTATHVAYWVVKASAQGQTVEYATFLDTTSGAETSLGSAKLTICFPADDVPAGTPGRSPLGIKLVEAALTFAGTFTTPTTTGNWLWVSIWTPYVAGVGTADPTAAVSAASVTQVPVTLSLRGAYAPARRSAELAGSFVNGGYPNGKLPLYAGTSRTALKRAGSTEAMTRRSTFRAVRRISRTTYFQVRYATPSVDAPQFCEVAEVFGAPTCVSATWGRFAVASPIVRVTFRK
jgi:hypothetical protein